MQLPCGKNSTSSVSRMTSHAYRTKSGGLLKALCPPHTKRQNVVFKGVDLLFEKSILYRVATRRPLLTWRCHLQRYTLHFVCVLWTCLMNVLAGIPICWVPASCCVSSLFQPTSTNLDAGPMFTERGLYLEATYVLWVMITVLVQKARLH